MHNDFFGVPEYGDDKSISRFKTPTFIRPLGSRRGFSALRSPPPSFAER
jgi:hypothetical protein